MVIFFNWKSIDLRTNFSYLLILKEKVQQIDLYNNIFVFILSVFCVPFVLWVTDTWYKTTLNYQKFPAYWMWRKFTSISNIALYVGLNIPLYSAFMILWLHLLVVEGYLTSFLFSVLFLGDSLLNPTFVICPKPWFCICHAHTLKWWLLVQKI